MAIDGALWLPFLLTIDKRMRREESRTIATNALNKIIAATEARQQAGEKALAEEKEAKKTTKKSAPKKTTAKKATPKKTTAKKTTTKKKTTSKK